MNTKFRSLIDTVDAAHDERMIKSAINSFAVSCAFERFAYLQTEGTEVRTCNTYPPEWQDVYLTHQYSLIDPVVIEARRRMEPFVWSADDWPSRSSSDLNRFRDQAIGHGIRSGMTIPVEGSFGSAIMLTFTTSAGKPDIDRLKDAHKAIQAALAVHYRLKIVNAEIDVAPKRLLSPREAMCLMWASKGKNTLETAMLTGINPRTVQHYLDGARRKLDAATVPQLVAIAKDRELL